MTEAQKALEQEGNKQRSKGFMEIILGFASKDPIKLAKGILNYENGQDKIREANNWATTDQWDEWYGLK